MLTGVRRLHLREGSDAIHFLSNKSHDETDFDNLRESIFKAASKLPSWKEDKPVRWIRMENELDSVRRREKKSVLTRSDIIQIAKGLSVPISDPDEVNLFLKYQHELGNIIYFEDIQDYIIIRPSWLIDAFKCLVCASDFRNKLLNYPDWVDLKNTGKAKKQFIRELLKFVPECYDHQKYVLDVMMKFDIIVRDDSDSEPGYIIPSMIDKTSTPPWNTIVEKYSANCDPCERTSWLCLDFDFLPPAIFNNILVRHMTDDKYKLLELYHKSAIFDINSNSSKKLVIYNSYNTICLQVWSWINDKTSCRDIYRSLIDNISEQKSKFGVKVPYKIKFMCGKANVTLENRSFDIDELKKFGKGLHCHHQSDNHILPDALSLATPWIDDQVKFCFCVSRKYLSHLDLKLLNKF